jgi:hypothetical protein
MAKDKRRSGSEPVARARGVLVTEVDCPLCRETFFVNGRCDDVVMLCDECHKQILVRLI